MEKLKIEALLVMGLLLARERKNLKKKIKGLLLQAWLFLFRYSPSLDELVPIEVGRLCRFDSGFTVSWAFQLSNKGYCDWSFLFALIY